MTCRTFHSLLAGLLVIATAGGAPAQSVHELGSLPLYFVAQPAPDGSPQFLASSRDSQVLISSGEVRFNLRQAAPVTARVVGASAQAQIHGEAELAGKFNYLNGSSPAQWRTSVPTFARVRVDDLYPGISAVYHGNASRLEYDFEVAPGTSPAVIQLRFTGADQVSVNARGELNVAVGTGIISQPKPLIYQTIAGTRREIVGGYRLVDARTVTFDIGNYDHEQPLVIDPILNYSTYFGGNGSDSAQAVAVNTNDGSLFVAGYTLSANGPKGGAFSTTNAWQTNFAGGDTFGDAFVAKFDTNFNLVYLTYLGGNSEDCARAVAVDRAGHAFVGGFTTSANFPVTNRLAGYIGVPGLTNHIGGPLLSGINGYLADGFVTELETNGSSLIYSTFLGGSGEDAILGLALDSADNVYVTGYTGSTNLPVTNAISFQLTGSSQHLLNYLACPQNYTGNFNAFVAKIASQGTNLDFCSYLGGTNIDIGTGIAVDSANNVYVTGYTSSTNFPTTNWIGSAFLNNNTNTAALTPLTTPYDAFVVKLAPFNATYNILYSTYLGSTNSDEAYGIAVDDTGAYVTGFTCSSNYYNTRLNVIYAGITNNINGAAVTTNVFLTKIVTTNSSLVNTSSIAWSVVFGGLYLDFGNGVAVDSKGDTFVVGTAFSPTFPGTNGFGLLATNKVSPGTEVFVTAFGPDCTNVLYSVLLGVNNNNYGYGIAVDQNSTVYLAGQTYSANFPVTATITNGPSLGIHTAWSSALDGLSDGIVASIGLNSPNYAPSLSITKGTAKNVTVSWLDNYQLDSYVSQFVLESATNLLRPLVTVTNGTGTNSTTVMELGTNWLPVLTPVSLTTTSRFVAFAETNRQQFFRLSNTNSAY